MTAREIINDASYDDVKDGFYNLINAQRCFSDFVGYLEDITNQLIHTDINIKIQQS